MSSEYDIENNILKFKFGFNEEITEEYLEVFNRVRKISFGTTFNKPIKIKIPSNVIDINFGYYFNQELDNLPDNLEHLILGFHFNRRIDNLPVTLKILYLSQYFNHPIDNLPVGLKELRINDDFNHSLDFLPNGLEKITFMETSIFSHSFDNLPTTLKEIEIPISYPGSINNLPDSIEEIRIGVKYKYYVKRRLICKERTNITPPFSYVKITRFPSNLKRLYIFDDYLHLEELKEKLSEKLIIVN